jgi:hypothetical protein
MFAQGKVFTSDPFDTPDAIHKLRVQGHPRTGVWHVTGSPAIIAAGLARDEMRARCDTRVWSAAGS